jgi:hypothetical protein
LASGWFALARQVQNAQAAEAQTGAIIGRYEPARRIGSTMDEALAHADEMFGRHATAVQPQFTADAAHAFPARSSVEMA